MSFKENFYQKLSFTDSFSGLTARKQNALENSSLMKYFLPWMKNVFLSYIVIKHPGQILRLT